MDFLCGITFTPIVSYKSNSGSLDLDRCRVWNFILEHVSHNHCQRPYTIHNGQVDDMMGNRDAGNISEQVTKMIGTNGQPSVLASMFSPKDLFVKADLFVKTILCNL